MAYIDREEAIKHIEKHIPFRCADDFIEGQRDCINQLKALPTADVVSKKAYEQVKWERDTAIEQLKSYGVGFCENADVVKVKQGEWIKFSLGSFDYVDRYQCSVCRNIVLSYPKNIDSFIYCHKCGARMKGGNK